MDEHSQSHLRIIGQLAREYEQKYNELETLMSKLPPETLPVQLTALAERTTERFRSAQVALLSTPGLFESEHGEHALKALTALCSAFDEMRILVQFILRNSEDG